MPWGPKPSDATIISAFARKVQGGDLACTGRHRLSGGDQGIASRASTLEMQVADLDNRLSAMGAGCSSSPKRADASRPNTNMTKARRPTKCH